MRVQRALWALVARQVPSLPPGGIKAPVASGAPSDQVGPQPLPRLVTLPLALHTMLLEERPVRLTLPPVRLTLLPARLTHQRALLIAPLRRPTHQRVLLTVLLVLLTPQHRLHTLLLALRTLLPARLTVPLVLHIPQLVLRTRPLALPIHQQVLPTAPHPPSTARLVQHIPRQAQPIRPLVLLTRLPALHMLQRLGLVISSKGRAALNAKNEPRGVRRCL